MTLICAGPGPADDRPNGPEDIRRAGSPAGLVGLLQITRICALTAGRSLKSRLRDCQNPLAHPTPRSSGASAPFDLVEKGSL
jgi:hypothetical protein